MIRNEWKRQTISLSRLESMAQAYRYEFGVPTSIIEWLKMTGIIPKNKEYARSNQIPNMNLDPDAIPVGYIAEVAYDWDNDGPTMPLEFVNMLRFEVSGSAENGVVAEILSELSIEAMK